MPQGKFKASKTQVPGKKKVNKASKTAMQGATRKGKFDIAPKKKRLLQASSVKRGLERGIRVCIEEELGNKTRALEPKALNMLKGASTSSESTASSSSK